jgi:Ca-activated chloride channel family protein
MTNFALDSPAWLCLLALIPAMLALAAVAARRRRNAVSAFADADTCVHLLSELDPRRRQRKLALVTAAFGLAVLALCRPAWDRTAPAPSKGRDILVLLDVSRSMYAQDLDPSRMDVARQALADFTNRLRGDRIGLIAFAGTAALRCPLTTDYEFFRTSLEGASPESVSMGGTEIGKAIAFALQQGFDDLSQRTKHLLLVTDAEDHGYTAPAAAAEAVRKGVRVDVLGLGDSKQGARVPIPGPGPVRYLTYQGQEVWSRLNEPAIRNVADAGGGDALVAGPGANRDLGAALDRLISGTRGKPVLPRVQAFWIPLSLAALCLALELSLSERRSR